MKNLTFNKWMLGAVLSVTTLFANAGLYNTNITGADMAGLQVTVTYDNNTTESLLWSNIQTILGTSGDTIVDHEGFSGSVVGNGWGLSQSGFTGGDSNQGDFFGIWSFYDQTDTIKSIMLDVVNTGLVFDTDYLIATGNVDTNGSGQGRPFTAFDETQSGLYPGATASYSGQIVDELYSQVNIDLEVAGSEFTFWLDTDKEITAVPEPSTLVVLLSGLIFLTRRKLIK